MTQTQDKPKANPQGRAASRRRQKRKRMKLIRLVAAIIAAVVGICLLIPESPPPKYADQLEDLAAKLRAWVTDIQGASDVLNKDSLRAQLDELKDQAQKEYRQLQKLREQADGLAAELDSKSRGRVATQEEADALNRRADGIIKQLQGLKADAGKIADSIHRKAEKAKELIDEEERTHAHLQIIRDLYNRGLELRKAYQDLADSIEEKWKYDRDGNPTNIGEELEASIACIESNLAYLKPFKEAAEHPEQLRSIQQTIESLAAKAYELVASFPLGEGFVPAVVDESLTRPKQLKFGDADLSIGAEGDLGETLVAPLVRAWLGARGYTITSFYTVARTDGSGKEDMRFEVAADGAQKTVDVICMGHEDACREAAAPSVGAHMVFYTGLMKMGGGEEKVCSDALVFCASGKNSMTMEEIDQASKVLYPAETANGIAASLFGMASDSRASVAKTEAEAEGCGDGSLLLGAYHVMAPKGKSTVSICYPGNRAYEPNIANISTGLYWYTYDVNCHRAAAAWKADEFLQYIQKEDAAQRVVEVNHFVPLNTSSCPELIWLSKDQHLPVDRVLNIMDQANFGQHMRYGSLNGASSGSVPMLKGCQLLYPIFFPTGKADGMELDSRADQERLNRTIDAQLRELARYEHLVVVVTGHADIRPTPGTGNMGLSLNRADNFLNNILKQAAGRWLAEGSRRGVEKVKGNPPYAKSPAKWYVSDEGNILVISMGASDLYNLCPKRAGGDKNELDAYYRHDRRAGIFVIVPRFEQGDVRARRGS